MKNIIIATPHSRNDSLYTSLKDYLQEYNVLRIGSKEDLNFETLNPLKPEWVFFPHWSWKIPNRVFENFKCVIFHMTDLPFGRGGSPLQNLIVRKMDNTVLTALKCEQELDAGPIYKKYPLSLVGTAEEILQRASILMVPMIVDIVQNKIEPKPQKGDVVIFHRRKPEDSNISDISDLASLYDYIRMLDAEGYPSAYLKLNSLFFEFSSPSFNGEEITSIVKIRKSNDK